MIIDTHSHCAMDVFDSDRDAMFRRAHDAGVMQFIDVGFDLDMSRRVVALANAREDCYCSVGMHPHHAHDVIATPSILDEIKTLAHNPRVVAYGEIGLDYFRNLAPRDEQIKAFELQIECARSLNIPMIIHCRDAHPDMREILSRCVPTTQTRCGVIHSFSGSIDDAQFYIALGFVIGIGGPITYPKNDTLKTVVREIPLEKMVLETDAPYLPPQHYRGKRNEPAYLVHVAEAIAHIKGVPRSMVEDVTTENARKQLTMNNDTMNNKVD